MSWNLLTDDWRLKLLALALAVLMLGAVAFSQNPPTTGSVTVPLSYSVPPGLILIDPPTKVPVTYSGLADVIKNVNASNMVASVDATHASPGAAVKLNVSARSLITNGIVNVQQPAPIAVLIDARKGVDLQVTVTAQAAPGWSIQTARTYVSCPGAQKANPCTVHFDGPASWEKDLQAYVVYPNPVNAGTIDSPGYQIQLKNDTGLVDLAAILTQPPAALDVATASVHIEAVPGSTSSSVPLLDSPPSHGPPPGYRVTGITISPITVTISGDPVAIGRIHSITLPPVDLSRYTSDVAIQVAITYPDGITGSVANAKVTYQIAANPNVTPS